MCTFIYMYTSIIRLNSAAGSSATAICIFIYMSTKTHTYTHTNTHTHTHLPCIINCAVHMCTSCESYGLATISRLLEIIGLFCRI